MGRPHIHRLSRLRVAVLLGGPSSERAVSLQSGRAVASALTTAGHRTVLIDPAETDLSEFDWSAIDVAFIALHGRFGEDGQVQQLLEDAQVPYTGSGVAASRLAISKSATKERFRQCGVPTPAYVAIHESDGAADILRRARGLGFPLVVKPDSQGSSLGVSITAGEASLPVALSRSFQYDSLALIEQYVAGAEFTAGFIDGQALPLIRIGTPRTFFDFEAKYQDDATQYEFDLGISSETATRISRAAAEACQAVGTKGLARVDLMLDAEERPWVLEVNTVPGLTDHSLVPKAAANAGIEFVDLCQRCLRSALDGCQISGRRSDHTASAAVEYS